MGIIIKNYGIRTVDRGLPGAASHTEAKVEWGGEYTQCDIVDVNSRLMGYDAGEGVTPGPGVPPNVPVQGFNYRVEHPEVVFSFRIVTYRCVERAGRAQEIVRREIPELIKHEAKHVWNILFRHVFPSYPVYCRQLETGCVFRSEHAAFTHLLETTEEWDDRSSKWITREGKHVRPFPWTPPYWRVATSGRACAGQAPYKLEEFPPWPGDGPDPQEVELPVAPRIGILPGYLQRAILDPPFLRAARR